MSTPNPDNQPVDQAVADAVDALMDCYNPPPLPAAMPVVNRWAEETTGPQTTPRLLEDCYNC